VAKTPKQRLTWFLIKPSVNVNDIDAMIESPEAGVVHRYRVPALNPGGDSLFVKASVPVPPKWLRYVSEHIGDEQLPTILGSSSSGVLLVHAADRVLALSFGYGRFLLKPDALVQDFGLKVVLNKVDPALIKSVDARTFDELTVHTRRGVSRDSSFAAFELDVSRDLLRGITGRSSTDDLEGALTGAAALTMNTPVQVPQLPALAETLVKAYRSTGYRTHFEWVDHMRAERDPAILRRLETRLLRALESRELTDMHLAIPEAVDWQEIDGVRFSFKRTDHTRTPDPKISLYRDLRDGEELTIKRLKADKIEAVSAVNDGDLRGHWRVYDCIVFETEYDGHVYVLSGGDWFRISKSYRDRVEAFVRTLPGLDIGLPTANSGDDEAKYNAIAAAAIGGLTVDAKLIALGGPDRVELCDILTKDGLFIHVKKRGRSSTLSHLFAQGITSTELLLNDEAFRRDAAELIASLDPSFAKAIPTAAGARDEIKVAYVILSRGQRPDKPFGLPFFSLVSLQAAARRLQNAGVEVRVQEVKER
jgi:uncharacterized protein (TIGR04141 family)